MNRSGPFTLSFLPYSGDPVTLSNGEWPDTTAFDGNNRLPPPEPYVSRAARKLSKPTRAEKVAARRRARGG